MYVCNNRTDKVYGVAYDLLGCYSSVPFVQHSSAMHVCIAWQGVPTVDMVWRYTMTGTACSHVRI